MGVNRKVKTIPATLTKFTATPITEQKKRRTAGYARVSTDHDDQFTIPMKVSPEPAPNVERASRI